MKNNILIYFIFYINNISFLRNEEKEQIHNQILTNEKEEQIQDNNIEDNINKNININENKKNIWILIIIGFSGFGLLLILLFFLYKPINKWKKDKKNEKLIKEKNNLCKVLIKKLIKDDINNLDFFILYNERCFQINKNNQNNNNFIDDFNKIIDNDKNNIIRMEIPLENQGFSCIDVLREEINTIKEKINDFKKISQRKPFIIHNNSNIFNFDQKNSLDLREIVKIYNSNYLNISFSEDSEIKEIKEILKKYYEP